MRVRDRVSVRVRGRVGVRIWVSIRVYCLGLGFM